jgi:multidrug efflux system membrane fusion protein
MKNVKNIWLAPLLGALMLSTSSCSERDQIKEKSNSVFVKTELVKASKMVLPIRTSGRLSFKTESKLSFKTGGIIREVKVDEGQVVNKGQLLASLDLLEIESQVRQAELSFEKAKRDLKRVENLYSDSVATLENLQDATTANEIASNAYKIARFNLQHSQIFAPSNGKILRKLASENELIGSGMPVFLFAPLNEEMVVIVSLTDREMVHVSIGDSAMMTFDAWPGEKFKARVSQIANTADPYTGTYPIELTVDRSQKRLVSGFIAKLEIFPKSENNFLEIPIDALVEGRGREGFVWVVEDSITSKQKIGINRIEGNKILVEKGLKKGQKVITDGASYVDEKSVIKEVKQ